MARRALALLPAVLALLAAPALADEVLLRNGRTLTGKATETGDTVVFERAGLRMVLRRDEVAEIRKAPSAKEEHAKKAEALAKQEADERYRKECAAAAAEERHRLGLWCATKGLKDEAKAEQERAVALDPDHAGARRALGFVRTEAGWRPEDEVMKEKGFVRLEGRWMPREEADALARGEVSAAERERRAKRETERTRRKALNAAFRRLADPDSAVRRKGESDLVAVAKEMGELDLEVRAPELRAYYDRAYEEISSARALVQVKAQLVTLKRPIPTFTTSLGGFGTPVTLQLPELSIISVNTTALLPLGIDEE
jgi:hypothetical protein